MGVVGLALIEDAPRVSCIALPPSALPAHVLAKNVLHASLDRFLRKPERASEWTKPVGRNVDSEVVLLFVCLGLLGHKVVGVDRLRPTAVDFLGQLGSIHPLQL